MDSRHSLAICYGEEFKGLNQFKRLRHGAYHEPLENQCPNIHKKRLKSLMDSVHLKAILTNEEDALVNRLLVDR